MAGQPRKTATKPIKSLEQSFLCEVIDVERLKFNSIDMTWVMRCYAKEVTCHWH